jgi:hypothetical protein
MNENTHLALLPEALYSKSQVYIHRGLRAKNEGEWEEYQLWASFAVELLAKSSLSSVHPSLVADPTHYQSLFAACGRYLSPDVKTITAKTLFERLGHISKEFDKRLQKFCEQLALRRNSEIHSGESPFSGMQADSWEKHFWYAIQVILLLQNKVLDEWLGAESSTVPKQLLIDAEKAVQMAVQTRIENVKEDFEAKHKSQSKRDELIELSQNIRCWQHNDKFNICPDGYELNRCPACNAMGILGGVLWDEDVSDKVDPDDPFVEYVEKSFSAEEFFCITCGLHLAGKREMSVTALPEEFCEIEEREREFEPDYGND